MDMEKERERKRFSSLYDTNIGLQNNKKNQFKISDSRFLLLIKISNAYYLFFSDALMQIIYFNR